MTPHSSEAIREERATPWITTAPHAERLAAYRALLSGPAHVRRRATAHAAPSHAGSPEAPGWLAWLRWFRPVEDRA